MFSTLDPRSVLLFAPIVLLSLTVHEYAHARVAELRGDPTGRLLGRVTLNPIVHLDILGTLMLLFGPVGWARPVPYDPAYFRNPRRDILLVAAAGPASNLGLALLLGIVHRVAVASGLESGDLASLVLRGVFINLGLAFFNLIPLPPLDGSRIAAALLPPPIATRYLRLAPWAPLILLLLILPGFTGHASPVWVVIGPVVSFFFTAFTGAA